MSYIVSRSVLILLVLATIVPLTLAEEQIAAYTHEDFVTSYWCGPPGEFTTFERYQEIKDANFTVAFPIYGNLTVERNKAMLDFCQRLGMKAIIHDSRMVASIGGSEDAKRSLDALVKDYAEHPALLAYHIVDEPGPGAFPGLGEVVAYLKERDPRHPGYINLLPSWAAELGVFGGDTYEQHVRRFVQTVKPAWISYDHYAMLKQGDRPGFFENLEIVRRVSLEAGIPFWNIVLCTQHSAYRTLTEPELRFEAMQTVAFGARGLVWFTYWSPGEYDKTHTWTHAMINPDGSRDAHYDMVKAINADVLAIGRELKRAKSIAVSQHGGDKHSSYKAGESPVLVDAGKVTVGTFHDEPASRRFAMLASLDYKGASDVKLRIATAAGVERFDPATRTWSPAGAKDSVELKLPPGGGVLLRWPVR